MKSNQIKSNSCHLEAYYITLHIGRNPVRNCPKMSVRIKISEDGFKALNEVFSNQKEFGPFVKSPDPNDLIKALKLMETGKENGSSNLTKPILFNILKALLIQQKWADRVEGEIENVEEESNTEESNEFEENEEVNNEFDRKDLENKVQKVEKSKTEEKPLNVNHVHDNENHQNGEVKKTLNVNNERKNLHNNVCKFYRLAKCSHGMTGKIKDKRGNTCQFDHPTICQKFRMFERNPEKGCLEKECDKLHYNFCKWYHDCKNMEDCKFYHPKRKQTKLMKNNNQSSFEHRDGSRPLQTKKNECNNCDSSKKMNFLGQYPSQVPSLVWENQKQSQAYQYKQPFSGPENIQEQNKKEMKNIFTDIEKLFNHAKSIML